MKWFFQPLSITKDVRISFIYCLQCTKITLNHKDGFMWMSWHIDCINDGSWHFPHNRGPRVIDIVAYFRERIKIQKKAIPFLQPCMQMPVSEVRTFYILLDSKCTFIAKIIGIHTFMKDDIPDCIRPINVILFSQYFQIYLALLIGKPDRPHLFRWHHKERRNFIKIFYHSNK